MLNPGLCGYYCGNYNSLSESDQFLEQWHDALYCAKAFLVIMKKGLGLRKEKQISF